MRARVRPAGAGAIAAVLAAVLAAVPACAGPSSPPAPPPAPPAPGGVRSWVYQLQGYAGGRLDAIAAGPHQLAVIDLARDAHADWFTAAEIGRLRRAGKRVLAYFEIGSIEDFRPEAPAVLGAGLALNRWDEWPGERFVRYWDERWWALAVRPRLDRALATGYDGAYLDTPLAYEEIDLALLPGRDRAGLAAAMAALVTRISRYAKRHRPGFWIVPQNSPELRHQPGYPGAIDGIGMEELFYRATDRPCDASFCAENLAETRALRAAGKLVLAVDYVSADTGPARVHACSRYLGEGFAGYPTDRDLDRISPPCPLT